MPFANPSAALVKAFLINGAVNIPGQYQPSESGSIPNANVGFGRVDMDATIGAGAAGIQVMLDEDGALDTGEDFRTTVDVAAGQILMMWVHAAMCSFPTGSDEGSQASAFGRVRRHRPIHAKQKAPACEI